MNLVSMCKYFPFVIFFSFLLGFCNYSLSYFGSVKYGFCRIFRERSSHVMYCFYCLYVNFEIRRRLTMFICQFYVNSHVI